MPSVQYRFPPLSIPTGYDNGMELRHLRYFLAVAEERHFGRAAERLHITQPPLSRQIRSLENHLGVKLFERGRRGAEPTEAARILLPEARAALKHADRLQIMAKRAGRGELGNLVVGFVSSATYAATVSKILRRFRSRFTDVELTLTEMNSAEQVRALNDGSVGVGFIRPPVSGEGDYLDVHLILEEPLVAALPESHRRAAEESIRLADLSGDSFVVFPHRLGLGCYDLVVNACRRAGFEPRVGQEAAHMQTIVGLVASGAGVSLVPASVSEHHKAGVVYIPVEDDTPSAKLAVASRVGDTSHTVEAFRQISNEVRISE